MENHLDGGMKTLPRNRPSQLSRCPAIPIWTTGASRIHSPGSRTQEPDGSNESYDNGDEREWEPTGFVSLNFFDNWFGLEGSLDLGDETASAPL